MGEKEDREKAEKLAAAKKRVAQLQKKKKAAAGGGTAGEKVAVSTTSKAKSKAKKDKDKDEEDAAEEEEADEQSEVKGDVEETQDPESADEKGKTVIKSQQPGLKSQDAAGLADEGDADEAAFNDVIKAATSDTVAEALDDVQTGDISPDPSTEADSAPSGRKHTSRQPSISLQSKIRSTSFRQSTAPLSPSALPEADESLYRKQALRIEELENENKALSKDASEGEARWRKSEEELELLREKAAEESVKGKDDELEKLREEIRSLRRNSRASISTHAEKTRQGSTTPGQDADGLRKEIESKESTIADLQLEISRMRSQVSAQTEGSISHNEQVTALQANLERAEVNARRFENELSDTKKALNRASEKAVMDGTEKTSKETKIKSLEKENSELKVELEQMISKMEGLEKKIEAMNKLHREAEQRSNAKLSAADGQVKEAQAMKSKMDGLEREVARLREARKRAMSGGGGDDGLEELEDEDRKRLERRVRELEGEVFELRRGVWRDRRKELQPGMTEGEVDGDEFDDVDLTGSGAMSRRRSTASQSQNQARQHSGFTQVISSGLAAFRNTTTSPDPGSQQHTRPRNDSLLQDFDDDAFDEQEFARVQREEEMKKMVEHVREVKRGLKKWTGWRLDLVDARRGGGGWGVGEVFDI